MKKAIITLSAAIVCSTTVTYAQDYIFPVLPIGCCTQTQTLSPCPKQECCQKPDMTSVFDTCAEIQEWKIKYFEKRCAVYTKLGLSQEQRVKAKSIDEKFFDEIAPLKICCKSEKIKYKEMKNQKCKWHDRHEQKEKIKDIKAEIKDKKKQHEKCFEEILTSCQKDSYKKIKKSDSKCGC